MPQSRPAHTPLAAAEPFGLPSEQGTIVCLVLAALGQVRFASESGLLAFAAPLGVSRADLETWCALGLIRRAVVLDGVRPEPIPYVSLTPRGVRELAASGMGHMPSAARTGASYKRLHDVQLGDFGLAVLALAREGGILLRGVQFDDRRLATSAPAPGKGAWTTRIPLQADGYVLTETERGSVGLLVELDRATTAPAKLKAKYAGYLAWKHMQGPERDFAVKAMRVVTIAPDEKRISKLHDAALDANRGKRSGFLLFMTMQDVVVSDPGRMLEPIARTLGGPADVRVPLFDGRSGLRDPQAVAASPEGIPPGRERATLCTPGDRGVSSCPPAVTASTRALML